MQAARLIGRVQPYVAIAALVIERNVDENGVCNLSAEELGELGAMSSAYMVKAARVLREIGWLMPVPNTRGYDHTYFSLASDKLNDEGLRSLFGAVRPGTFATAYGLYAMAKERNDNHVYVSWNRLAKFCGGMNAKTVKGHVAELHENGFVFDYGTATAPRHANYTISQMFGDDDLPPLLNE